MPSVTTYELKMFHKIYISKNLKIIVENFNSLYLIYKNNLLTFSNLLSNTFELKSFSILILVWTDDSLLKFLSVSSFRWMYSVRPDKLPKKSTIFTKKIDIKIRLNTCSIFLKKMCEGFLQTFIF